MFQERRPPALEGDVVASGDGQDVDAGVVGGGRYGCGGRGFRHHIFCFIVAGEA